MGTNFCSDCLALGDKAATTSTEFTVVLHRRKLRKDPTASHTDPELIAVVNVVDTVVEWRRPAVACCAASASASRPAGGMRICDKILF